MLKVKEIYRTIRHMEKISLELATYNEQTQLPKEYYTAYNKAFKNIRFLMSLTFKHGDIHDFYEELTYRRAIYHNDIANAKTKIEKTSATAAYDAYDYIITEIEGLE